MFVTGRCKKALLACALFAALATPPRSAADANPRQGGAASAYTLHVTVTDGKGNLIQGLKREAFAVFAGGRQLEIASFSGADAPASIAVVLDASGSMREGTMRVRNALLYFFSKCRADDEFFIGAFNHGQQLLVDGSNDPAAILKALDRYALTLSRGLTAIYDALYLAHDRVSKGRHPRRAIVLISDGQDNASRYTFREVERALRESDVTLYAVFAPASDGRVTDLDITGRTILEELTAPTGGHVLFPTGEKGLNEAMTYLAGLLRGQYALGVVPAPSKRKDNWHEVKVKVADRRDQNGKLVKLRARTRQGFYWPEKGR